MKYIPWVLLILMFFITGFTVRSLQGSKRDLEVSLQNEKAAADETQRVLRDQIAASTRLAVQARIDASDATVAMQEALDERDASLVVVQQLEVQVGRLERLAQVPRTDTVFVENGDTVRVATFVQEGPPIEGEQTVRVSQAITLDSHLRVSPFSLGFGVGCAGTAPVFTWDTPDWVDATFQRGTVDPSVCYTPSTSLFEISTGKTLWLGVGLGLGFLIWGK
jgi:hypothetical protein